MSTHIDPNNELARQAGVTRTFQTGATRDADTAKPDYEGFLSPLVIREFGKYMHKHRIQSDGGLRDSDNWQKGIPLNAYLKSAWRHFHDLWSLHRGYKTVDSAGKVVTLKDSLTALLFNVQGYLHEVLKQEEAAAVALGVGARTVLADPPAPTTSCRYTATSAADMAHAAETRTRFLAGLDAQPGDFNPCPIPPAGWRCTRGAGHPGPCAAVPVDLDACGTTDGQTPIPEWPGYIGYWNLPSGGRPQTPGCWRISANGDFGLVRDDGQEIASAYRRDEFIRLIKEGEYVPNTWPIPVQK